MSKAPRTNDAILAKTLCLTKMRRLARTITPLLIKRVNDGVSVNKKSDTIYKPHEQQLLDIAYKKANEHKFKGSIRFDVLNASKNIIMFMSSYYSEGEGEGNQWVYLDIVLTEVDYHDDCTSGRLDDITHVDYSMYIENMNELIEERQSITKLISEIKSLIHE